MNPCGVEHFFHTVTVPERAGRHGQSIRVETPVIPC
jgi:hypothetical protein